MHTKRLRGFAAVAGVTAAMFALVARPALAGVVSGDGDSAAWTVTLANDSQYGALFTCSIGAGTVQQWSCSGNSHVPIVASGANCTETATVTVSPVTLKEERMGCSAQLDIASWFGTAKCSQGSCSGTLLAGSGTFTYQPVGGAPARQTVTITASCSPTAGHATVTGAGTLGNGQSFSMNGALDWVGSCTNIPQLTWSGTVNIV